MNTAVLWVRENEFVLGELQGEEQTLEFVETAATEASFPLEAIITKSEIATQALKTYLSTIFTTATPASTDLEVWLPPSWGMATKIPTPSLPEEEIPRQITWELSKQLQTDLDYYLYLYRDRGDGMHDVALMRPAVVAFWKGVLLEHGYNLSAIRFALPDQPISEVLSFDFKSLSVTQPTAHQFPGVPEKPVYTLSEKPGSTPPEETITEEPVQHNFDFSKSARLIKRVIIITAIVAILSAVAMIYSNRYHNRPKAVPHTVPLTDSAKGSAATSIPDTVTHITPVETSDSPGGLIAKILQIAESGGKLELVSISSGEAMVQIIADHDPTEAMKAAWKMQGGKVDSLNGKYDAPTDRFTLYLPFLSYKADESFAIPTAEKLTIDGSEASGELSDLTNALKQWQKLPFRVSIVRHGNLYRIVVVK